MDDVVREVIERLLCRVLSLLSDEDRKWNAKLLFADNKTLVADLQGRLRQLIKEIFSGPFCPFRYVAELR